MNAFPSKSLSGNHKSKSCPEYCRSIQNRKWVGFSLIALMLAVTGAVAQAQQPAKIPRIGYLAPASLSALVVRTEAFRQGLRELGYVEGKTIVVEWRSA